MEVNNKKRPAGSGTTTGTRREQRQAIQWSALQQADKPVTSISDMEKQLEALKKATASAKKQIKKLEKAEEDSQRGKRASSSKPGKKGYRSQEAEPSLAQLQQEQEVEEKLASLRKELEASFGKGNRSSGSGAPPESLKKERPLKKDSAAESSLKKVDRPLVVIDWHNTLEKGDAVPEENLEALKKVLDVADVRIISWVHTEHRRRSTLKQIRELIPEETLKKVKGYQCIWYRCGDGGKVDWACHYKAEAVFDDRPSVCEEARDWGLVAFAIAASKPHPGSSFWTFAEAAESYLKKFDM